MFDDEEDDDQYDDEPREPQEFGCCLPPGECVMPGLHFPSECHTAADYEQDEDGQFLSIIAESADAVPLTDEKIDHTLATTLDEFARTTRGMSHALDVNADITANSRLRRMFARAVLAAAGDKP